MNRQVRRLAVVVLAGFLALFAAPLYWQVLAAPRLNADSRNTRALLKEASIQRGQMYAGDGKTVLADSVATNDPLNRYLRRYPQGDAYGMLTGYYSLTFGTSGLERAFDAYLVGKAPEQFTQNLSDYLTAKAIPGGTLVLTIDPATQKAAQDALGPRKGAVVALDYRTGAVLAMTTFPRFDPNPLASHSPAVVRKAWARLNADPSTPLLNRATQQLYPAGSTFKVITAAAAFDSGMTPDTPRPDEDTYDVPQTSADIRNFGGEHCPADKGDQVSIAQAFEVSCNTVFAHLGVDLGRQRLVAEAEKFGLNAPLGFQLPSAVSQLPADLDVPALAQSAIGQRDVRVSPLQMAEIAATVANGGARMRPFVVSRIVAGGAEQNTVKSFGPHQVNQALSGQVADELKQVMALVVSNGTGTAAQIPGLQVFGKTGTAQNVKGKPPHAWFIGFTSSGDKTIAVAVVVENGGNAGSEATGGRVAAPIAKQVMQAYLGAGQ
jgi:peptidoglycan glycosyltransferase